VGAPTAPNDPIDESTPLDEELAKVLRLPRKRAG
jgi:hypothetical protein